MRKFPGIHAIDLSAQRGEGGADRNLAGVSETCTTHRWKAHDLADRISASPGAAGANQSCCGGCQIGRSEISNFAAARQNVHNATAEHRTASAAHLTAPLAL
jgi:hypothetical protein